MLTTEAVIPRNSRQGAVRFALQETLAETVGTTRSRVNVFMKQVSEAGVHRVQRGLEDQQLSPERRAAGLISRTSIPARSARRVMPASKLDSLRI
jgi:hypothetical protein